MISLPFFHTVFFPPLEVIIFPICSVFYVLITVSKPPSPPKCLFLSVFKFLLSRIIALSGSNFSWSRETLRPGQAALSACCTTASRALFSPLLWHISYFQLSLSHCFTPLFRWHMASPAACKEKVNGR